MIASKIFALFALAAPSFAAALVAAEDTEPITTLISTNVVATVTTTVCDLTASHPEGVPPTELPVLSTTCISGVVGTEVPSSISVVVSVIPSSIAGESGSVTIQTSTGTGNETASPANSTATPDASSHGVSTITSTATVSASGSHASESTQPSESAPPSSAAPSPSLANAAGGIKLGMLSLAIALVAGVIGA